MAIAGPSRRRMGVGAEISPDRSEARGVREVQPQQCRAVKDIVQDYIDVEEQDGDDISRVISLLRNAGQDLWKAISLIEG